MSKERIRGGTFVAQNQPEALSKAIEQAPGKEARLIKKREVARADLRRAIRNFGDIRENKSAQAEQKNFKEKERFVGNSLHLWHNKAFELWMDEQSRIFSRLRQIAIFSHISEFLFPALVNEEKSERHFCIEQLPNDGLTKVNLELEQLNLPPIASNGPALAWKKQQYERKILPWYWYLMIELGRRQYPPWFRYFVLRSVSLKVLQQGKEHERHADTLKDPVELDEAALSRVWDYMKEEVEQKGNYSQPKFLELYEEKKKELARKKEEFKEAVKANSWLR